MNSLLNGEFEPITASIGLINASLQKTTADFLAWGNEVLFKYGQSESEIHLQCSFRDAMKSLFPLVKGDVKRRLLLAIGDEWTAYFDNGWRGSDPAGVVAVMSGRLVTTALRLTVRANTRHGKSRGTYGARIFEAFEGSQKSRRSIACANDGGHWIFEQFGEPYPFEDVSAYQCRKLSDRFPAELLEKYVNEFGVNPFSEAAYTNENDQVRGFLIEKRGNIPKTLTNVDLAEARHALGLE
jgi:hypothetical protein